MRIYASSQRLQIRPRPRLGMVCRSLIAKFLSRGGVQSQGTLTYYQGGEPAIPEQDNSIDSR